MARAAALVAAALVLTLVPCAGAWAGAPTDALRDVFSAVNRALDDPELRKTPPDLRAAIRNALVPRIDSREAARLALGDVWTARTPAERDQFASLFGDHFERTYVYRVAAHAPMYRALAIRYVDETSDGRTATVTTALGNREGGEVPVEYRLIKRDGRWAIFDVVIDGASLVDNYKLLFSRVIGQSSYSDVVALMKPRPSEARAATAPAAKAPEPPPATPPATSAAPNPDPPVPSPAAAAASPAPVAASPAPVATNLAPVAPSPSPGPAAREQTATVAPGPGREPAATALAAPKPPAPGPAMAYWLQVGAFKNPEAAGGLAARLRTQNLPVSIESVTVPPGQRGTQLSRVRVGPFADQTEATAKLRELETSGYRPFLAVERKSN